MNDEHYLDRIISKLRALNDAGFKQVPNGTLLIGKLPPLSNGSGAHAYLHVLYAPLTIEQIETLEEKIARPVPEDLRRLLQHFNGLSLFSGSLSIGGLRFNYSRKISDEERQPVSLEYGNVIEKPLDGEEGHEHFADNSQEIRFGFYSKDPGANLMMKLNGEQRVYAVPRNRIGPVLHEWSDLPTMLSLEVDRMAGLYQTDNSHVDMFNPMPTPWQSLR